MITGYVGVAPGTTTLVVPSGPYPMQLVDTTNPTSVPVGPTAPPSEPLTTLTYEQYLAQDIALRQEALILQRRAEIWGRIGTFATASLASLALFAALGAWYRTGKLKATPR